MRTAKTSEAKFLVPEVEVGESLDDYGCRRHGEHASEEKTVDMGKTEHMTDSETRPHHSAYDKQSCDDSRSAGIDKFLETKFKTKRKQQDDNADLSPELDIVLRAHRGKIFEMRTCKKTGHNIA